MYFMAEKSQGKTLFQIWLYVNKMWTMLHSVRPGWTLDTNTHRSENSFPEALRAYLNITPFSSSEPINILAFYANCPSLKSLQDHSVASKDFPELKPHRACAFR